MFDTTDFNILFEKFKNQKVLVIGDVMIDTYLWGNVGRVSPEAPVPIVSEVTFLRNDKIVIDTPHIKISIPT